MTLFNILAEACVAVMDAFGRKPASHRYAGRHWQGLSVEELKEALATRVASIGTGTVTAPDSEEPTMRLTRAAAQAADETGVGILRPIVDGSDDGGCPSATVDGYQCEREDEHDTCSALDGTVTWPRQPEMAVA